MTRDVWEYPQNRTRKILSRFKDVHLDSVSTNFHQIKSNDNSSELLWLLSLYSAEIYLPRTVVTRVKIIPNFSNIQEYFQETYWQIRKIWYDEYPANVLFTGQDVVFLKPVDFSHFSGLQMFNYAHPKRLHNSNGNSSRVGERPDVVGGSEIFNHYLNADIRYYSHDMDERLWSIGDSWANNWVKGIWEYEQDLYNAMLRSHGEDKILIAPEYAYQAPASRFDDYEFLYSWNQVPPESAKLVHLHSSHDPKRAIEIGKKLVFKR